MKKIVILIAVCAVAIAGYAAAGPFWTIHRIKSAIESQDPEKLARLVDFPALRSSLKEQLTARVAKEAASGSRAVPFAGLAAGFSARLAEGLVDSVVTPAGITVLIGSLLRQTGAEGRPEPGPSRGVAKPLPGPDPGEAKAPEGSVAPELELFSNARYAYDGLSRFSVWVKEDRDLEIRFVLIREGLSWKLAEVILPAGF